ncbi:MAG: hypothetical protein EPN91_08830 [Salinibacterium sp.]|nr:MAG: hypothetical protein EPN91_08830 [Salinibacterium sp.]
MSKAQVAALLLAGASVGVGGREAVGALLGRADAAPAKPFTHAVDLRRDFQSAEAPKFLVYGNVKLARDAGVRDLGQATQCTPLTAVTKDCTQCMNGLAKDCMWTWP